MAYTREADTLRLRMKLAANSSSSESGVADAVELAGHEESGWMRGLRTCCASSPGTTGDGK